MQVLAEEVLERYESCMIKAKRILEISDFPLCTERRSLPVERLKSVSQSSPFSVKVTITQVLQPVQVDFCAFTEYSRVETSVRNRDALCATDKRFKQTVHELSE